MRMAADAVAECFHPVRFHSVGTLTRLRRTLCVAKKFYDLLDGIPVACCRRDTQELLDLAEITDRFSSGVDTDPGTNFFGSQ